MLGLDPLDEHLHDEVLVAGFQDAAAYGRASLEVILEIDPEPRSELLGVADGAPDTGTRGAQADGLLDAVCHRDRVHMQPLGCLPYLKSALHATHWLHLNR